MLFFRIAIVICVFCLVTFLFRKASGSLKFTKLNMISLIYYFMILFNLIGASLIYLGLRDHYLIQKIKLSSTIDTSYYALAYAMIMLPLVLMVMKLILSRFAKKREINAYVASDIYFNANMINMQGLVLFLMAICTLATAYVFINLGYIPLLSMIRGENLDALRQSGNRFFSGNQYVKNLLMTSLTPFVSYLTYIYFRITKRKSWCFMFCYMALLSVIVLTYDFAKSPIITYLLGLYLLEVVMGNVKNRKRFNKLAIAAASLILFFYVVVADVGASLFSIYTGPIGRIIFTQIATLFLHVEAFPLHHAYLNGASFNGWMSFLFPAAEGLRSGRVVMSIYNAAGVESNTAGVMNTVFIGEAYANYGFTGILVAPIVFGIIIGLFAYLLPSLKKSPVSILLYVQMTLQFVTMIEGGFVDILYSASTIFIILLVIVLKIVAGHPGRRKKTGLSISGIEEKH